MQMSPTWYVIAAPFGLSAPSKYSRLSGYCDSPGPRVRHQWQPCDLLIIYVSVALASDSAVVLLVRFGCLPHRFVLLRLTFPFKTDNDWAIRWVAWPGQLFEHGILDDSDVHLMGHLMEMKMLGARDSPPEASVDGGMSN